MKVEVKKIDKIKRKLQIEVAGEEFLKEKSIGSTVYYPLSLHMQECFAYLGYSEGDFPHSELAAEESLALPIYTELTEEMIGYVVDSIVEFHVG